MLKTARRELARRIPHAEFFMPVNTEQMRRNALESGVKPINRTGSGNLKKIFSLAAGIAASPGILDSVAIFPSKATFFQQIEHIDAMVDISGFAFSDETGERISSYHRALVLAMFKKQKPCIYFPQAWGPFNNRMIACNVSSIVRQSSAVFARDSKSYRWLLSLTRFHKKRILRSPDIAFLFRGDSRSTGAGILAESGAGPLGPPRIGIIPNQHVYGRCSGTGTENSYVRLLMDTARFCTSRLGGHVFFIMHEFSTGKSGGTKLDTGIFDMLERSTNGNKQISFIRREIPAETIKSVIGNMDIIICSRFHGLVAALSQNVPSIAIGWSHKYGELMNDAGLGAYNFSVQDSGQKELNDSVLEIWNKRKEIQKKLHSVIPLLKSKASKSIDITSEIILGNLK